MKIEKSHQLCTITVKNYIKNVFSFTRIILIFIKRSYFHVRNISKVSSFSVQMWYLLQWIRNLLSPRNTWERSCWVSCQGNNVRRPPTHRTCTAAQNVMVCTLWSRTSQERYFEHLEVGFPWYRLRTRTFYKLLCRHSMIHSQVWEDTRCRLYHNSCNRQRVTKKKFF